MNKVIYSLNNDDMQNVAMQKLNRHLTKRETLIVQENVGNYIDWFQAIDNAISDHITA